jgi:hypothetical protein
MGKQTSPPAPLSNRWRGGTSPENGSAEGADVVKMIVEWKVPE